jgi:uncharacterized membrane-anchored protein
MDQRHLPTLNARYWVALCLASIFGANMGDFFAHNIGLGHVAGLPFLAVGFAVVILAARADATPRQAYYWIAIILVRTAATNLADFAAGDLRQPRPWIIAGLTLALAVTVYASYSVSWRHRTETPGEAKVLYADTGYWIGMLVAGTLGTVIGDYVSHNLQFGDPEASVILGGLLALLFAIGRRRLLWIIPYYWLTVVMVRSAGTVVGDLLAGRNLLGLATSTLVTGLAFAALLLLWQDRREDFYDLRRGESAP